MARSYERRIGSYGDSSDAYPKRLRNVVEASMAFDPDVGFSNEFVDQ